MPITTDRYPGLRSFEQQDAALFFGRINETEKLATLILSERTVVVFGKSGVGKSSLLNTAFFKSDKLKEFLPLKIRLQQASKDGENFQPLDIVKKELECILRNDSNPQKNDNQVLAESKIVFDSENPGLWEFLKLAEIHLKDQAGQSVENNEGKKLVLIFDQFEEFFNLPVDTQNTFKSQLAELAHPMPPRRILDWVTQIPDKERSSAVMQWYQQPDIKIILSIRSDKLFLLSSLTSYIPQILKTRFELGPFNEKMAALAVRCPGMLEDTSEIFFNSPKIDFDPEVVEAITEELSVSGEIDSSLLQIVCWSIEENVKTSQPKENTGDLFKFTKEKFVNEINMSKILDEFYKQQVDNLKDQNGKDYPAETIHLVRIALEEELVDQSQRTSVIKATLLKILQNDEALIASLINSRLIREEKSARGSLYELSHDKLIAPLERARALRHQEEQLIKNQQEEMEKLAVKQKKAIYKQRLVFMTLLIVSLSLLAGYFYIKAENAINNSIRDRANIAYNQNNHYLAFRLWDEYFSDWFRAIKGLSEFDKFGEKYFYDISGGDGFSILKDGRVVVSNTDKSIFFWDISAQHNSEDKPNFIARVSKPIFGASNMLTSFDKRFLAYRDLNGNALIYDIESEITRILPSSRHKSLITSTNNRLNFLDYKMTFLDRSNYLAFIMEDGNVNIWDSEKRKIIPLRILERKALSFTSWNVKGMFNVSENKEFLSLHRRGTDSVKLFYLNNSKTPKKINEMTGIEEVLATAESSTFVYRTINGSLFTFNPQRPVQKKLITNKLNDIIYSADMSRAIVFEKDRLFVYDFIGDSIEYKFNAKKLYKRFSYDDRKKLLPTSIMWTPSGRKFTFNSSGSTVLIDLEKAESFPIVKSQDSSRVQTIDGYAIIVSPDESKYCYINQTGQLCVYPIDSNSTFKGYKKQIYNSKKLDELQNLYQLNQLCLFNNTGTTIAYIENNGTKSWMSVIDLATEKEIYRSESVSSLGYYFNDKYIHVFNGFGDTGGLVFFNFQERSPLYFKSVFPKLSDEQKRDLGIKLF